MKTKTHLFDEFQSKEDIIKYGRKKSNILITSMMTAAASAGLIPLAFADVSIVISIIGKSIIQIGKYYGYVWKKISKNDLKAIYNGKLYSPEIQMIAIIRNLLVKRRFLKLLEKCYLNPLEQLLL